MHKEIKNNNKQTLYSDGDANANQIPMEESHTDRGSLIPPLLSHNSTQERIIIWGTHARSKDPELEEFELLECQEMEAFLTVREVRDNDTSKEGAKKDFCQRQSALACKDPVCDLDKTDQNANHSEDIDVDQSSQPLDLRTSASRSGGRRSLKETRSNSDSNVFVPSFSTVSNLSGSLASALDSAGHKQCPPLPSKPTSDKCRFQQAVTNKSLILSTQSKEQPSKRGQNHSSMIMPQDPTHEHRSNTENGDCLTDKPCWSTDKGYNKQENVLSSKFQRNIERVPPSCRQLVRPLSPGMEPKLTSGHPAYKDTNQGDQPSPSSGRGRKSSSHQPDLKDPVQITSNAQSQSSGLGIQSSQTSAKVGNTLQRQGSAENAPGALERKSYLSRRAYSSPTRPATPPSPKSTGSPQRRPPMSPGRSRVATRGPQLGYGASQGYGFGLRPPVKTTINVNVQNSVPQQSSTVSYSPPKCPPKPKSVRPKIITYVRKNPQMKPQANDSPYEVSSLPTKLSTSTSPSNPKTPADEPPGAPVLSASNLLYDKYRQELQKSRYISPEALVSGTNLSSYTMPHKATGRTNNFYGSLGNKYLPTVASGSKDQTESQTVTQETGGYLQPPRTLRPQLGVGAVNKSPSAAAAKSRVFTPQKSPLALSQPVQAVTPSVTAQATSSVTPSTQSPPEASDQWKAPSAGLAVKSLLPKPAPSGLRPPGYSRLPAARLAAFGFVRSSSVSSVSSNNSADSTQSEPCRPAHRPGSITEDPPFHRVISASCGEGPRVPFRSSPQPPSTPVPTRRPLLPPPPGSPVGSRKDFQKTSEGSHSVLSSPKRLAVVSPKPQSPVLQRPRAAARVPGLPGNTGLPVTRRSISPGSEKKKEEAKRKEKEIEEQKTRAEEVLQLQTQCKEQNGLLLALRAELKRTVLGLDILAICTQHFCLKSENAEQKEKELFRELSQIQEEVACTAAQWKLLQQEKTALEQSFVLQLKELQEQQEAELATLEEELRTQHASDTDHLTAEHQSNVEELRTQQQEQIEELTAQHESDLEDLRTMHNLTMARLQEEHARTMRDLRKIHEKKTATLENDFEKHKLSLQDQVDMLTFQNRALQDKAKRFEEALRKSADEQILDALAPYQHIEQDLRSLKEVLEMKNQQIHDQERKICHLEKVQAQKNIYLEEKVQVLQQQNEDLKARIDRNVAMSRQLSEENANLHEHVERESNEKKRLSRNNEELLWLLQTSPHLSPSSSPSHKVFFPGFDNPPFPGSPSPGTPTHSYSPGPSTPAHKVSSPSPGTPTHRALPATRSSPARVPNANTLPR
ncbi:microtubule-associated tumor suppressor candidate 2 isoform X1 [Tachysurus fulvidraco]|uniref:microtubule-associated tumor suppressor candidate 2 isoform X1 n=1 Tax=Tachysurus fulvidraco TaxID=1234273 RepID=UPI001FEDF819|nr:microtubule-associated tumor suppressor candidate 2 isoform X1 [Tachysurus fulvidraco]XP_047660902.1 microtubule-associated tumor suppressor candidate 2 isoform X1 [Tachysurus fulvidraco]XP_047660903.1 microtubule-associated tumor suppressor candidate 2 isoform X1 [Tachysurus fulvidraco]XP_047660904.1 microtubule-associated tumor suppressor candidate 2 isoform X1 [Tachysurus fulvidraco]XP_047660905.1 microtubule-associated tumor suppressor candidate 2 isoform X1 [Tachysurus fulvidraco]XP_04